MSKYRIENDSLGEVQVPADAFWGAQTQRAVQNFSISGLKPYPAFIWSMAVIKRAAAEVNSDLGLFHNLTLNKQTISGDAIAQAIMVAADEVIEGKWNKHFVVDPLQAGASASHNINTNEVIANVASRYLGFDITNSDKPIHPEDHVNLTQSTNEIMSTAVRLGCLWRLNELLQTLGDLAAVLRTKAEALPSNGESGRTVDQETEPIKWASKFGAYALSVEHNMDRISQAAAGLRNLDLGGSGTAAALDTDTQYHGRMVTTLSRISGLTLYESDNFSEAMQGMDDFIHFSGSLRTLAQAMTRIAHELRELTTQSNSIIKQQTAIALLTEMLIMTMSQIMGNDLTILLSGQAGQLELSAMMPIIAHNLFQTMDITINTIRVFTDKGIQNL